MWPDKPISYIKIDNDEEGKHFGLFINNELVSVVSLFLKGREAQFRKFATLNKEQGKGYGSQLLNYLFEQVKEMGVDKVWCNARIEKCSYYRRFGMNETAKSFEKGGKSYLIMERLLLIGI